MTELRQSPLHDRHVALGAKFAEFSGWSMPLQYSSIVAEHTAVRTGVGLFDVSHLGKTRVSGPGTKAFLNDCLTNDLDKIAPGQAQYTLCCTRQGGVVDDLMAYLVADDEVFLIPNAANNADVVELLSASAPAGIVVTNEHRDHFVIAVQGPHAGDVLGRLGLPVAGDYLTFQSGTVAGVDVTVCRTGYTGERGYELLGAAPSAGKVWDALLESGQEFEILPAGLGARDTLRTEMGYCLHGHELSMDISPVQAMVGWAVGWDKASFWGDAALRAERADGPARRIRGLRATGRGIPRPGMEVVDAEGKDLGRVTSGTFSPTLKTGIALALLDASVKIGDSVGVVVRNRTEPFTVEKLPLVPSHVR